LNDIDAARLCFDRALNLNPSSVQACTGLGEALFSLGRFDEAKVMYVRGIKSDPGNQQALAGLQKVDQQLRLHDILPQPGLSAGDSGGLDSLLTDAYKLFEEKRYKEALGTIAEVELALDQRLPEDDKQLIHGGLENLKGFNYLGLNNLKNARLCFEKGLNADPGSSEACAGLGETFYLSEMDAEAKTMYEWGVMNNPGNPFAVAGLAKVNKVLGLPAPHNSLQSASVPGFLPPVAASRTE
jgi:tetratricopeptide (TPR) repeat protein